MNIRYLLASTALTALSVAPAVSADLPPRPAAVPAFVPVASFSWTGFYLGASLGGAWSKSTLTDTGTGLLGPLFNPFAIGFSTPPGPDYTNKPSGVIGGVQGGYNWQMSSLVLGVEVDYSFTSAKSSSTISVVGPPVVDFHNSRLSDVATFRGRLGWAFDRVLVYGTGGAAYVRLDNQLIENINPLGLGARDSTVWGWTAGGGVEYALTNNWTLKGEYLHIGLSDSTQTLFIGVPTNSYVFRFHDSVDIARVGINYKF